MLLAASDYAGSSRQYDVIGCVVTSYRAWEGWESLRRQIRQNFRLGVRRISYTKLNDKHKMRALGAFLQAVSTVEGVLCCVAVNKTVPSFVDPDGTQYANAPELADWQCFKPAVFERMLRAASVVSMLVAGLAAPGQEVGWVTDEDEIASNENQLQRLAKAFGSMAGVYSSGRIPTVRVSTTANDATLEAEDLAAVADLAAGTVADVFTALDRRGLRLSETGKLDVPEDVPPKAHTIGKWLRIKDQPLRRLFFVAEKGSNRGDISITPVSFT